MDTINNANKIEDIRINYPLINKLFLFFFCGYVVIWYLQIGYRIPVLGTIRFEFIYAAILTALAFFFTPKFDLECPLVKYVLLYFMVIIIQIPFSYDFNTSWYVFVNRIIKFAFMSFFIVSFVRSPKHLKWFFAAFLLACLKMGQEGMMGRITGGLMWQNQEVMRLHGSTPNYAHPNSFAGMALGTLPFIYYFWPLANKYIKTLLLLTGILSLNIVIYTGSRTGYVAVLAFLGYIYLLSNNKKKFLTRAIILSFLALPMIPLQYSGRFNTIFADKEQEGGSIRLRKEIFRDAVQIFTENPIGVGIGAFPQKRMDTFGRSQDTHNLYLEIATNLGVQGLIVFALLIYELLMALHKIKIFANNTIRKIQGCSNQHSQTFLDDLRLIEAAAVATSTFVIIRLALGLFGMDLYEIYWWFAIGITLALHAMMNNIQRSFAADSFLKFNPDTQDIISNDRVGFKARQASNLA